jgi:hypothetical protein
MKGSSTQIDNADVPKVDARMTFSRAYFLQKYSAERRLTSRPARAWNDEVSTEISANGQAAGANDTLAGQPSVIKIYIGVFSTSPEYSLCC